MNAFNNVHNGDMKKVTTIIESSKTIAQFELGAGFYLGQFVGEDRKSLLEIVKRKGLSSFNCVVEEHSKELCFFYNKDR